MLKLLKDLFSDTPPLTFDDVASDYAKNAREAIRDAARQAITFAAEHAAEGEVSSAHRYQREAEVLWAKAITIPLDMGRMGL